MDFIYKHKNKLFVLASILILIPFLFNIGLEVDEPFTMGLIRNSYGSIIHLTALDVHPPLYYFTLKFFLSVTTFWTSNIFIKIIFARLLSLIFMFASFIYLRKSLSLFNINNNVYFTWLMFLLMPLELGLSTQSTNIRMYALITMFFSMIIYYMIKFYKNADNKSLIYIFFLTTLTFYTNYFGGTIIGIYMTCQIVNYYIHKSWNSMFKLILTGVFCLIAFMPWIPSLKLQLKTATSLGSNLEVHFQKSLFQFCIEIALIIFIFSFPILIQKQCKTMKYIMYPIIISAILSIFANILLGHGKYAPRYLASILINLEFIGFSIFINHYKEYKKAIKITITCLVTVFAIGSLSISSYRQITRYFIPQFSFIRQFNNINKSNNKNISINSYNLKLYPWNLYGGGDAVYLYSINKNLLDKEKIVSNGLTSTEDYHLYRRVFPNIKN